jgi:hypothetical protein
VGKDKAGARGQSLIGVIFGPDLHVPEATMTSLRPHLDEGYAELLDSFGNVAAEWHDWTYAQAILNGECTVQRWHRMFHDMAIEEGYIVPIDDRWVAAGWLAVIH